MEIGNRKTAIKQTIHNLKAYDTLVIAGKGHENYQEVKGVKKHFCDKEIILEYINRAIPKSDDHELQLS
jgi:UDP-N-acetylmuramoyl-L-alanyl-D-glutamate--2,6-diaminopimelate ligase